MFWFFLIILILGDVTAEPEGGRLELLEKQVAYQQTWLQELQNTINLQQDLITKLTTKLQEKTKDEKILINETIKLLTTIEHQGNRISDLENIIKQNVDRQDTMKTSNHESNIKTTDNNLQHVEIPTSRHDMVKRNLSSSGVYTTTDESVAFEAIIAEGKVIHLPADRNIVFDAVNFNMGNGYNKMNGVFTAPARGIYLFSTSVTIKTPSASLHVDIEKNGVEIAGAVAHSVGPVDTHNQGSVTIVVLLEIGDKISVRTERHGPVSVYGDKLTSFSGLIVLPL
ncbi:hypothetical protein ACF0H5_016402 [Mactra antiquata]